MIACPKSFWASKQADSLNVILVVNSVFTLGILRTLAQTELDFCIRHHYQCEEEPNSKPPMWNKKWHLMVLNVSVVFSAFCRQGDRMYG